MLAIFPRPNPPVFVIFEQNHKCRSFVHDSSEKQHPNVLFPSGFPFQAESIFQLKIKNGQITGLVQQKRKRNKTQKKEPGKSGAPGAAKG
jgi:hypothetical protein